MAELVTEIRQISNHIQNHENAVREADETYKKQHSQPPPFTVNIAQTIDIKKHASDSQQDAKYQSRNLFLQAAMTLFTAGAFGAASYYACYAKKQVQTMNDTYGQMQQQTVLMQKQVEAAMAAIVFKQFRISWPESYRAHLSVILDNRGRVVASNIRGVIRITKVSLPHDNAIGKPFPEWKFTPPDLNPSPDLPFETGTNLTVSPEDLKGIGGIHDALKLTGTFTYFNGFHDRVDELCYYVIGSIEFRNKSGIVQQTQGAGSVITCGGLPAAIGN